MGRAVIVILKKVGAFFSLFILPLLALPVNSAGQSQVSLSKPMNLKWEHETKDIVNLTPAVSKEAVYLPLSGGAIISLRVDDGRLNWKAETGGAISASPAADERGVYVPSENITPTSGAYQQATGSLRALSQKSGVTLWMRTLAAPLRGALASNQETLFGGAADGRLYAIKKETGEVAWVRQNSSPFLSEPVLDGGNLYIGDDEGGLFSINQKTGETFWRYRTRRAVRAPVAVAESTIYAGSADGYVYALNKTTGRLRWRVRTGASVQSVLLAGKCLLAASLDNFVYCLSPESGVRLWKRQMAGRIAARPLATLDGVLFSPLAGDECVVLDLSEGRKINSLYVGEDNNTAASPLLAGQTLLLTTRSGLIAYAGQMANASAK